MKLQALALGALLTFALTAQCADGGGLHMAETVNLGNERLQLNGQAVGQRFVFKVYTIGLYLPTPTDNSQNVFQTTGPRRLAITMLREVAGEEFADAIKDFLSESASQFTPTVMNQVRSLCAAIARLPNGLNKGTLLTMDWVPGTGAVVEVNRQRVMQPANDPAFYNALLNVWLGEKPLDPAIKAQLLRQRQALQASAS